MESKKKTRTEKPREWNDGYQGLRGGGIGQMLLKATNLQLIDKSWSSNAWYSEYRQQNLLRG